MDSNVMAQRSNGIRKSDFAALTTVDHLNLRVT